MNYEDLKVGDIILLIKDSYPKVSGKFDYNGTLLEILNMDNVLEYGNNEDIQTKSLATGKEFDICNEDVITIPCPAIRIMYGL